MTKNDFEKFFDLSLDLLCTAGPDGYLKRINPAFERALGWTREELLSRPFIEFIHPHDAERTQNALNKLAEGNPTVSFENRCRSSDGTYMHLRWTVFPEEGTGLIFAIVRESTDSLDQARLFRLAMDSSPAAMVMVNEKSEIVRINKSAESLFGYTREGLVGRKIETLVPSGSHAAHRSYRAEYLQNPEARPMGVGRNLQAVRKDGSEFPVEIGLNPIRLKDETLVLCSVVDLTVQKRTEEQLRRMALELEELNVQLSRLASIDKLTGLKNRRTFDEEFDLQIQLMSRMAGILSLLMIDIDYFKKYNDHYGHLEGDEALKAVAHILSENSRTTDVVARFGGEEFAILLPDTAKLGAIRLGERFREAIHNHTWDKWGMTISVGASTISFEEGVITRDVDFRTRLLSEADQALYHAKSTGRDRVIHIFDIESSKG